MIERPSFQRRGMRRFFGNTEELIMDVLWSQPDGLTTGEIVQCLTNYREKPVALTTVSTVTQHLVKKGLVSWEKQGQNRRLYRPAEPRAAFLRRIVAELMEDFPDVFSVGRQS